MRTKLKLDLDALSVDSFGTSTEAAENGTVFAEQCTCYTNCTCPGCPSCDASCDGTCNTCENSCYGTCGEYTCRPMLCEGQTALYTACGDQQCH